MTDLILNAMVTNTPDLDVQHRIFSLSSRPIPANSGTNNGGANLTISSNQSLSSSYYNVGTFTVNAGVTLTITSTSIWQIKATTINILGNINANSLINGGLGAGQTGGGDCYNSYGDGGGGSYGGSGTSGDEISGGPGSIYGSTTDLITDPIDTGSSGGADCSGVAGGYGGGGIYLYASGNITVSGNITTLGGLGSAPCGAYSAASGSGSGGGILLNGSTITINTGATINVAGGNGVATGSCAGGTGGGGRIKMVADNPIANSGTMNGVNGTSAPNNGTLYVTTTAPPSIFNALFIAGD